MLNNRFFATLFKAIILPLVTVPGLAFAEYGLNLPKGVTPISRDIYGLHMTIFWVCVGIAVIVFGIMIYSMIYHRKSRGAVAANFHESTTIELIWTAVPLAILIAIAVPATKVLIDLENTEKADMTVKITGYQWKWQYEYLDNGVNFFSNLSKKSRDGVKNAAIRNTDEYYLQDVDNRLVLPVNTRVRFLMTSNDVIHSWWVRELGVKQDANPGFINDSWAYIEEEGVYRGKCTELCGKDHGFMPVVVEVVSKENYAKWVEEQQAIMAAAAASGDREWSMDELMTRGQEVYSTNCAACHGATGAGIAGSFPAMAGSAITTEAENLEAHIDIIINGKSGTAMQAFGQQLNDSDIAAVVTYERNAFGNNTGDITQPAQIKSAR